ncbi:MAG: hydantoinase/oxoprolinase family protein [Chloroflexota bacterium]|nr:hydantoinase/oxoprolinase family protein [Chloroflexota bacterium]
MAIALGIDTGGTYTDAVLVEQTSGAVIAVAKALTTYHDLSIGIGEAVTAVFEGETAALADVSLVGLSTTLATNSIVERRGSLVCLLLIGYDPTLIRQYSFEQELATHDVVYLRGGHDGAGNEAQPLDEAAAREAILARRDRVEAFAVSGYFGVRNPAHELRVRALVEELTAALDAGGQPLPVTCGHELTSRLNSVRRATTTALNARLIPLLRELIATVRRTLDGMGIAAPLMIVKGDGSLVRAEWAARRPIETILSGPAASVVGACHLAGRRDVWVVDVGGTTTDIAVLHEERPRLNPEGAQVGQWRTMVEAVDAHTVGLGGDSLVCLDAEGRMTIGPQRVLPLCMLASTHSGVVDELRQQVETHPRLSGQFVLAQRQEAPGLSDEDRALLRQLAAGPQSLAALVERATSRPGLLIVRRIKGLEARRLVLRAGFTPTDALHVLGRFEQWNSEASRIGAELLAERAGISAAAFCEQVATGVSDRVATALVSKVLSDEEARPETGFGGLPDWEREPSAAALLARALGDAPGSDLGCQLTLRQPMVAVGAPVEAYLPRVAGQLHTELIIPAHAEVANAVGAVAGGVVLQRQVLIRPVSANQHFRLHLPDGVRDVSTVEEGVTCAQEILSTQLLTLARQAGADQVEVRMTRVDQNAPVRGEWGQQVYLGTRLTFTAVGRPAPARRA